MRTFVAFAALVAPACSPIAPQSAQAQQSPTIAACVEAAADEAALQQCRGVVAQPCMAAPGGDSTMGMVLCLDGEGTAWKAVLDAAIARLNAADPNRAEALMLAQSRWDEWLSAECGYRGAEAEGGSAQQVYIVECANDYTSDRAIRYVLYERSPR